MLLTGLPFLACFASFFVLPRATCLGVAPPTPTTEGLGHSHNQRKAKINVYCKKFSAGHLVPTHDLGSQGHSQLHFSGSATCCTYNSSSSSLRQALSQSCYLPWLLYQSPGISKMMGSLLSPMTFWSLFCESDTTKWCESSSSPNNSSNPGVSKVTELYPQQWLILALHDDILQLFSMTLTELQFSVPSGRFLYITQFGTNLKCNFGLSDL